MTNIYIDLTPEKIRISNKVGRVYDANTESYVITYDCWISLEGPPKCNTERAFLDIKDGEVEIKLPDYFSIRIGVETLSESPHHDEHSQIEDIKNNFGFLHYLRAYEGDFESRSEPASLHADIKVSKKHFDNIVNIIESREAKIVATLCIQGISLNHAITTDISGHFVSWDIKNSRTLNIEDFYINASYVRGENNLNKLLRKKLTILENEIKELKNKKISIF